MISDGWIILCCEQKLWGETVKSKTSPAKKCHHFDIGSFLTFSIAAWEIHISNASRHTGVEGGAGRGGILQEGWFDQAAGGYTSPPSLLAIPSLFHSERGNKSDRVQSLSLICQWGEWVGMRLSDRPAAVCLPCQPYWIMTRQEVARYESRRATARYHGHRFSMRRRGRKAAEMKPVCM